jgi:putative transposase
MRGGNKRTVNIREVVNGIMYILSTGCQWHALPQDLPPKSTVDDYFDRWRYDRTLDRIHHALYVKCREQTDCGGDRQPEREERGRRGRSIDPHAFDAGKKIRGKKRHILVDT